MCDESTRTKIANDNSNDADPTAFPTAHRQAALAALSRELDEIDELRAALDEKRQAYAAKLAPIEEMIEETESRIADEAEALGVFDDEYECDCGCTDEEEVAAKLAPEPAPADETRSASGTSGCGARAHKKRAGAAPLVFGALSIGCAVASLLASWLAGTQGGSTVDE